MDNEFFFFVSFFFLILTFAISVFGDKLSRGKMKDGRRRRQKGKINDEAHEIQIHLEKICVWSRQRGSSCTAATQAGQICHKLPKWLFPEVAKQPIPNQSMERSFSQCLYWALIWHPWAKFRLRLADGMPIYGPACIRRNLLAKKLPRTGLPGGPNKTRQIKHFGCIWLNKLFLSNCPL